MTRLLLCLALLLTAGCDTPQEKASAIRCTRAGGFIITRNVTGNFNGSRQLCVKELILPVEVDSATTR